MSTFITTIPTIGDGPRLAVKDLIDVAGVTTTAGSQAVADFAFPAAEDARLLQGFRDAGYRIVGKANLHELAFGTSGVNSWSGTPENPLDPSRIPGGSSSGSAVAVATDLAEIALGSDTGGSIRIPAAFCGVTGLKTTFGRIPLEGVWALAPSLDTVGPMARDVAGVVRGMELLVSGFTPASSPASTIGRLRPYGEVIDPVIDEAIDEALRSGGFDVVDLPLPEWGDAWTHCTNLLLAEAWEVNAWLVEDPLRSALLGDAVRDRLISGSAITTQQVLSAKAYRETFLALLTDLLDRVELLALPSAGTFPPLLADAARTSYNRLTNPVNLAGLPALSLPVPTTSSLPAGLQLIGAADSEDLILATGLVVEASVAR